MLHRPASDHRLDIKVSPFCAFTHQTHTNNTLWMEITLFSLKYIVVSWFRGRAAEKFALVPPQFTFEYCPVLTAHRKKCWRRAVIIIIVCFCECDGMPSDQSRSTIRVRRTHMRVAQIQLSDIGWMIYVRSYAAASSKWLEALDQHEIGIYHCRASWSWDVVSIFAVIDNDAFNFIDATCLTPVETEPLIWVVLFNKMREQKRRITSAICI